MLKDFKNFTQAGGPITRAGWRMEDGTLDHLYVYKRRADGTLSDSFNYLESWKSLENVGFEVLFNFQRKLGEIFKDPSKHLADREGLFRYLYQSYIAPGASEADFKGYFAQLEHAASRREYLGKNPDLTKPQKFEDVYRYEVNRALSRILKRRIPTKFLRLERGRLLRGGKNARLWDSIQQELSMSAEDFDSTIKDITTAEVLHRNEVSELMARHADHNSGEDKKFNHLPADFSYHFTRDRLRALLSENRFGEGGSNRIERAMQVFERLDGKVGDAYLDHFAVKLQYRYNAPGNARRQFTELPYAIAPEEFDMRFFNWRGAGPGVLKRLNNESARVETEIVTLIKQYPQLLRQVGANGKQDFGEIVDALDKVKETMNKMAGGTSQPTEMVGHLAAVTIAYFKKDTVARNIFTKLFVVGGPSSLAAEFAGTGRGVWEWEVSDIHKFIAALEARRVIPKRPTELGEIKVEEVPRKYLGKRLGKRFAKKNVKREAIIGYSGGQLRKDFGAQGKHIFMEILNKYVPLVLAIILMAAIADGVEDALEDVRGKK